MDGCGVKHGFLTNHMRHDETKEFFHTIHDNVTLYDDEITCEDVWLVAFLFVHSTK